MPMPELELALADSLKSAAEFQFDDVTPNNEVVKEVFSLDASRLADLAPDTLSSYIVVLGQYLVRLQYQTNMLIIEHMLLTKTFEHKLTEVKFLGAEEVKGKTEKERRALAILNSDSLRKLEVELTTAEAKKILVSDMVKAVSELLNALKKEKAGKDVERYRTY